MPEQQAGRKPFLPRDKPRSWVLFILCCLTGLLVAGPLLLIGSVFEIRAIESFGRTLFWCCLITAALMWAVFMFRSAAGRYDRIVARDWKDQIW